MTLPWLLSASSRTLRCSRPACTNASRSVEALRLQTAPRLYDAIAVYVIIVAWRLHLLTMLRVGTSVLLDSLRSLK